MSGENLVLKRSTSSGFPKGHQIWILSEFGKPIFSSCGHEDELCSTFALIQVFVKRYETWKDSLYSIQMPNLYIQFSYRSPLILCIISPHPYNLNVQLDIVYNQVISILCRSMLKSIYGKMGDNFDLRRYLNGIERRIDSCVKGFNEDPVVFLSGFRILPLNAADREFIVQIMATSINQFSPNNVVFAVLMAHRQLVAIVRMRRLNLSASDFNMIVNMTECHSSLRDGETWVPICLPQFDPNSFLHAHISYLWEGKGPCLIFLSVSKEAFFDLAKVRAKVEKDMDGYKKCARLKEALSRPDAFATKQISCPELWHFMYKNTLTSQVCCSSPQKPYIAYEDLLSLYHNAYFRLTNLLRRTKNSPKMFFMHQEEFSLFAWTTTSFELYCTFSPLVMGATAIKTAENILRVLRENEKRVFFNVAPGLLADSTS